MVNKLPSDVDQRITQWLGPNFDEQTRREIQQLIDQGEDQELIDRFYTDLDFGTGGLRGIIGAGTNRMNQYVVGMATQGLANYILKQKVAAEKLTVVIAYDCRRFSREFAKETARVLAGNGIKAVIFDDLRPVPELSFAVRQLGAVAGVVITASHNPKEYNGYKVYWTDGAQVIPPHDHGIINEVREIKSINQVKSLNFAAAKAEGLIAITGQKLDEQFLAAVSKASINPEVIEQQANELKLVYTPLHGTGIKLVPQALEQWGFKNVVICKEQAHPDGEFPTVISPNPEEPKALEMAINQAKLTGADLVLATDPDCDRLGIAVRIAPEHYQLLTGNRTCALLTHYLLNQLEAKGRLPRNGAVVTTIVTTRLIESICHDYQIDTVYTLTGFKWICGKIRLWEEMPEGHPDKRQFIYGTEESYGHLIGTHARDKDGVVAACVVSEMAAWAKAQGKTLLDLLHDLYMRYGMFIEEQKSLYFEGPEGQQKMEAIMEELRRNTPKSLAGLAVEAVSDVEKGITVNQETGETEDYLDLPRSNVIVLHLAGGSKVIARPSGTEPKIKFYFLFCDRQDLPIKSAQQLRTKRERLEKALQKVKDDFLANIGR